MGAEYPELSNLVDGVSILEDEPVFLKGGWRYKVGKWVSIVWARQV